jgi:hypothetical protein
MKTSLGWTFESMFGCHHQQLSRVFTIRRRTYQVCIECGREFDYSWALMHAVQPSAAAKAYVPLAVARPTEAPAT